MAYNILYTLNRTNNTNKVTLDICNEGLFVMPTLAENLTHLFCFDNCFTELPALPETLVLLFCQHCNLTKLPDLPKSLLEINCSYNKLLTLPDELPPNLIAINCQKIKFDKFPDLPASCIQFIYEGGNDAAVIIKLEQHNEKRTKLDLITVEKLTDDEEIREEYELWKYRIDGDKYCTACDSINTS